MKVKNLSFSYHQKTFIENLNIEINLKLIVLYMIYFILYYKNGVLVNALY